MTPKERFLGALARKEMDRPAVGCVTQSVTVDQMDWAGVEWPAAHTDAQMMAKLGIAGAKVFGFENARSFWSNSRSRKQSKDPYVKGSPLFI